MGNPLNKAAREQIEQIIENAAVINRKWQKNRLEKVFRLRISRG